MINFDVAFQYRMCVYLSTFPLQGPRNCIGMRFALLSVKFALLRVVHSFRVVPGEKTPAAIEPDPKSVLVLPKGGTWVKVEKRD